MKNTIKKIQKKHNNRFEYEIYLQSKKEGLGNPAFLKRYNATKKETIGACIFGYVSIYPELDFVTVTHLKSKKKKSYDLNYLNHDCIKNKPIKDLVS
jgi:hypothetical protein